MKIKALLLIFISFGFLNSDILLSQANEVVQFEKAKSRFIFGFQYYNNMKFLAAAEYFREALTIYPEYHTAREYLARSYRLAGYVDEALSEWEHLNDISDNPSVKNKIDTLRYLDISAYNSKNKIDEVSYVESLMSANSSGYKFPYPYDITIDTKRNIYITSFSSGKVVKFNSLKKGSQIFLPSSNSKISGIDTRNQILAFADFANDVVYITNDEFKIIHKIGKTGSGESEFHGPNGVYLDEKGYLYVVDTGNHRIQKFNSSGKFVMQFGKNGEYEGEFASPSDITQIGEYLYITDTDNKRIVVFDVSGNYINTILLDDMQSPIGISSFGTFLIISDTKKGLIYYNTENKSTEILEKYKDDNSFVRLNSAVYDREGFLYALDHARESVEILAPLKKKYSNLDVEITSVDTRKFPTIALYVNVKNRNGLPVYALEKDNFAVTEDKAMIRSLYVDYFKDKKQSVKAEICIDRSIESKEWHGDLKWVNEFILQKLTKDDKVKILNFNSTLWTGNDFDWSRRRALKAVSSNEYSSGKNFGKAIYSAISDMVDSQNKRSVIVITDGSVNNNSFKQYDEKKIIYFAREHYVPVYFIYFSKIDDSLKRIALSTGGKAIKASNADTLRDLYSSIKESEEYRYAIIYTTFKKKEQFAGWWSDITIEVNSSGQKGIEWGGYFVPEK